MDPFSDPFYRDNGYYSHTRVEYHAPESEAPPPAEQVKEDLPPWHDMTGPNGCGLSYHDREEIFRKLYPWQHAAWIKSHCPSSSGASTGRLLAEKQAI